MLGKLHPIVISDCLERSDTLPHATCIAMPRTIVNPLSNANVHKLDLWIRIQLDFLSYFNTIHSAFQLWTYPPPQASISRLWRRYEWLEKNNSANYRPWMFVSPQEMWVISSVTSGGVPGCALTISASDVSFKGAFGLFSCQPRWQLAIGGPLRQREYYFGRRFRFLSATNDLAAPIVTTLGVWYTIPRGPLMRKPTLGYSSHYKPFTKNWDHPDSEWLNNPSPPTFGLNADYHSFEWEAWSSQELTYRDRNNIYLFLITMW